MLTPVAIEAVQIDSAVMFALKSEPRNIHRIVWITGATLCLVVIQSVYLFVCVSEPIAKLERTVAKHDVQIETIIGAMEFSDTFNAKILENLNGR